MVGRPVVSSASSARDGLVETEGRAVRGRPVALGLAERLPRPGGRESDDERVARRVDLERRGASRQPRTTVAPPARRGNARYGSWT